MLPIGNRAVSGIYIVNQLGKKQRELTTGFDWPYIVRPQVGFPGCPRIVPIPLDFATTSLIA